MLSLPIWHWWQWVLVGVYWLLLVVVVSFVIWLKLRDDHEYDQICGFFVRLLLFTCLGFSGFSLLGLGWVGAVWGAALGVVWGRKLFERMGWQAVDLVWPVVWLGLMSCLVVFNDLLRFALNLFAWLILVIVKGQDRRWQGKKFAKPGVYFLLGLWLVMLVETTFAIRGTVAVYFAQAIGLVLPPAMIVVRSSGRLRHIWQKVKRKKALNRNTQNRY